ncbi:MAG: hypothetical protein FWF57_05155 [Defluviitaleaceae bacterium]|nr:hypothetical protein [Defluviitaleaceae bacterium]
MNIVFKDIHGSERDYIYRELLLLKTYIDDNPNIVVLIWTIFRFFLPLD